MFNLIIRAVTDKGGNVDLQQIRMDALLTFTMIHKCAQEQESFPDVSWIPNVWKHELYPEFMNPEGSIVAFLMIKPETPERTLNLMYFKVNDEGRRTLKILHENIIRASEVLTSSIPDIQGHLTKHGEISADYNLVIRKDRLPGDNSGVFKFQPAPPFDHEKASKEGIALTFDEAVKRIDLAPGDKTEIHIEPEDLDDWYSSPAMDESLYRIYINGKSSTMLVDDINFMKQIYEKSANGLFSVHHIPGNMEMTQSLFDLISKFLQDRDFKIGAHPAQKVLEDGNDANHSIFWNRGETEILYVSPLGYGGY